MLVISNTLYMKRLISLFHREWGNLHEAALLLGLMSLFSQALGFVRDRMLAGAFGASGTLDMYYSAFRVPDFLYDTIGSAVAITVLIPFIAEYLKKGEGELKKFMSAMFTAFIFTFTILCVVAFVLMPTVTPWLVPGFTPDQQETYTSIARILLLSPILQGLSNLYGSITQSLQRFFVYALSPAIYNVGIIIGILFLSPHFGVYGLAYGVVFGAFLQNVIQLPVLFREGLLPVFSFAYIRDVARVVKTAVPRTIALSSSHLATVAIIGIASHVAGGVAVFSFAMTLQGITFTLIGSSYSVAAFPTFAKYCANGETEKFRDHVLSASRHIIFWSLPIMALFIVIRAQIVRVVLGTGQFDWNATRLVAAALAIFVISVTAQSLVSLFTRAFYAAGNNRLPLLLNALSALSIIGFSYALTWFFGYSPAFQFFLEDMLRVSGLNGTAVLVLPLAYSAGMIINATLLLVYLEKHIRGMWTGIRRAVVHSFSVSVIMGFAAYHTLQFSDILFNQTRVIGVLLHGGLAFVVALIVGIFFFAILRNREYLETADAVKHKFWKKKPLVVEQETVVG